MTKKEIVKQISEKLGLTQLKTKEIVQLTFDAIVDTLLSERRIELRNFGVFEVKRRKARKARNPRTGDKVDVGPKNVVTFKPGKEMEERIRQLDIESDRHEPRLPNAHKRRPTECPCRPVRSVTAAITSVPRAGLRLGDRQQTDRGRRCQRRRLQAPTLAASATVRLLPIA